MECSPVSPPPYQGCRSVVRSSVILAETHDRPETEDMTAVPATCAYPDCERPVAPPPPTGGRSSYCSRPDHNRTTAFAARRAEAAGHASTAPEAPVAPQPGTCPAETLTEVADRLGQTLGAIEEQVGRAREVLTRAADAELLEVERAAVRSDARREIAEAEQRASLADRVRAIAEKATREVLAVAARAGREGVAV